MTADLRHYRLGDTPPRRRPRCRRPPQHYVTWPTNQHDQWPYSDSEPDHRKRPCRTLDGQAGSVMIVAISIKRSTVSYGIPSMSVYTKRGLESQDSGSLSVWRKGVQ